MFSRIFFSGLQFAVFESPDDRLLEAVVDLVGLYKAQNLKLNKEYVQEGRQVQQMSTALPGRCRRACDDLCGRVIYLGSGKTWSGQVEVAYGQKYHCITSPGTVVHQQPSMERAEESCSYDLQHDYAV